MQNIVDQLYRDGNNSRRLLTTGIVLHWDGKDYETEGLALAKAIASSYSKASSFGKTIPYHIRITKKGEILQCLNLNDMIYHCHNNWKSRRTIAVCVEDMSPNEIQLAAVARVVGFLKSKYRFISTVEGHSQVASVGTGCPGKVILDSINNFNSIGSSPEIIMESPYTAGDLLKVTGNGLNMRLGASEGLGQIPTKRQLKKGEIVVALGHAFKGIIDGKEYTFVDVQAHNPDESGWVATNYVKLEKKASKVQAEDREALAKQAIEIINKLK